VSPTPDAVLSQSAWAAEQIGFAESRGIGYNATISAPHMHAYAAENLLPLLPTTSAPGGAVLDVGSGSGYCRLIQTTDMWRLAARLIRSHRCSSPLGSERPGDRD
jgi:protein-L-isoaspartate O-methyltransferase